MESAGVTKRDGEPTLLPAALRAEERGWAAGSAACVSSVSLAEEPTEPKGALSRAKKPPGAAAVVVARTMGRSLALEGVWWLRLLLWAGRHHGCGP